MNTRRLLIIGLLILLFLLGFDAGRSSAATLNPPPGGWGAAYYKAAIEYWHGPTTRCFSESIHWDSPYPEKRWAALEHTKVLGVATVTYAPGHHCNMWLAPLAGYGVYFRCVLFAHEYGHWKGHPDNPSDPWWSVKYELLGEYTHDRPCRELVRRAENPETVVEYTPEGA